MPVFGGDDTAELDDVRRRFVQNQIADRGVVDPRVLEAMYRVPRHLFVSESDRYAAYDDRPLPIGMGQTISQPYMVAYMAEAADLDPDDRVLEIGTGSGYGAAVLAELAARVWTIERHHELVVVATERLARLGYDTVEVIEGDGTLGWPPEAPYDAIVVTAAGPEVPDVLLDQLADGGRLVIPVGRRLSEQRLISVIRQGEEFLTTDLGGVRFVPLIGAHGESSG